MVAEDVSQPESQEAAHSQTCFPLPPQKSLSREPLESQIPTGTLPLPPVVALQETPHKGSLLESDESEAIAISSNFPNSQTPLSNQSTGTKRVHPHQDSSRRLLIYPPLP